MVDLEIEVLAFRTRNQQNEFVAAHSRHVIGRATLFAQAVCDQPEHLIAREMAKSVVYELESVQIADNHGQRRTRPLGARQFVVEGQEERTRVGQIG